MAKAKPKSKPKIERKPLPRSYVTLLLDRSSSMESIKSATIEGFNVFLGGLKAEKGADIFFTFLQFDYYNGCSIEKVFVGEHVAKVPLLTHQTFQPRGGTPLIEAAHKTILAVEEAVRREEIPPKVVICIQTDGEENQSAAGYTWHALSQLVKAKQEIGWQFNFLGAGLDAYQQAAQMSIPVANTLSYGKGVDATRSAYGAMASNTASFSAGVNASTAFMAGQKTAAGDVFDPAAQLKPKSTP